VTAPITLIVASANAPMRQEIAAALRPLGFNIADVTLSRLSQAVRASAAEVAVVCLDPHTGADAVITDIMTTRPVPIVGVAPPEAKHAALRALGAGALEVIAWPGQASGEFAAALAASARVVAGLALVKRRRTKAVGERAPRPTAQGRIVAIGASTGGPQALAVILRALHPHTTCPIVIVQHMSPQFMGGFVDWLGSSTGARVRVASAREPLDAGHVYVAPGGHHLLVSARGVGHLGSGAPVHACRPSADVLFESVAATYQADAVGVLLSGMGEDGARGLLAMRRAGARTIAQDAASAVVYGMPAVAAALEAADTILPLDRIASAVVAALSG
jgi:two-component system chemotaxis response regulator CheB